MTIEVMPVSAIHSHQPARFGARGSVRLLSMRTAARS
jgi:hypothetical protein